MSLPHHLDEEQSCMDIKDSVNFGGGSQSTNAAAPSWQSIRQAVRSSRKLQAQLANKIPHNFTFLPYVNEATEFCGSKLLFLGVQPGFRENTLLFVYVQPTHSPSRLDNPVQWKQAMQFFQVMQS